MGNATLRAEEGSEIDSADEPVREDSEMSTTDVSGDTADIDDSDSDGRPVAGAAALDAVVAAVAVADSIDQVEDIVDNFLSETGTLSSHAAIRIDLALQERTNDVYFAKLQQSLCAGPAAVDLVKACGLLGLATGESRPEAGCALPPDGCGGPLVSPACF